MLMRKFNIGIVGVGYWARNIIRELQNLENAQIIHLCDTNYESARQYQTIYRITQKAEEVFNNPEVDIVFICTRIDSHFSLAKQAILSKTHVWLEKPSTRTSGETAELIRLAKENNVILHIDHTFLYSNPINYFKKQIESGVLGDLYYIESTRTNYGPFQKDLNTIFDLAPHCFSILNYITNQIPISISAVGTANINEDIIDEARITVNYDNFKAYINVSWLSPQKARKITIAGANGFLVNDSAQNEIVERTYKGEVDYINTSDNESALKKELKHFFECIELNEPSKISSGIDGFLVMRMIEAANMSIENNGIDVRL